MSFNFKSKSVKMEKSQMDQIESPFSNDILKNITNHFNESSGRSSRSGTPTSSTIKPELVRRVLYQDEINKDTFGALIESLKAVEVSYPIEYFPDLLQIHEFLNVHLDFLMLRTTFTRGVTMEYLESAIIDRYDLHLYQLMYIFLAIVFKYRSIEAVKEFSKGHTTLGCFTRSTTSRFYNCEVYELTCDEFTISEVLRLHLITSSTPLMNRIVESEAYACYNAYQKLSDEFIKENGTIIQALHYDTIYRLSSSDLLKIFNCLLNQILTFDVVRKHIEVNLASPSNYLGRDEFGCTYWRFSSIPGIYVECNNNLWKYIDTRKIFDELLGVMVESHLKQNLEQHGHKSFEEGRSSNRRRRPFLKNYRFRKFYSFDDWSIIWEEKLCDFETLIKNFGLVCNDIKIDYVFFQKSFSEWEIPSNMEINSINLNLRQTINIDQKLCQLYNLPERSFPEEYLNVIRGQAARVAFAYYKLNGNRVLRSKGVLTMSPSIFEMFLGVQSVGELFLSFYKLNERLLGSYGSCDICHASDLGANKCNICSRRIHSNCFGRVPMAVQYYSINCHVCQFRLEQLQML